MDANAKKQQHKSTIGHRCGAHQVLLQMQMGEWKHSQRLVDCTDEGEGEKERKKKREKETHPLAFFASSNSVAIQYIFNLFTAPKNR